MNAEEKAREVRHSRVGGRWSLLVVFIAAVVLVCLAMAIPAIALSTTSASANTVTVTVTSTVTNTSQSTTTSTSQSTSSQPAAPATVSLSRTSGGPGEKILLTASGLAFNRSVSATFNGSSLQLSGTCVTSQAGKLSGCYFLVPHIASGSYTVSVSDGTSSVTTVFKIPSITIPESTLMVTITAIGLSLVTQLVTRRVVDLDAERRMRAEISAFNKEKREATLAKDKAKLEKLKKRELPMRQEQAKVSTARLKVTAITFVPLLLVYYLMASFLGGFSVVVANSSLPIPYLVGGDGTMALFWWYMLSSFTFSTLLTKLLHTGT